MATTTTPTTPTTTNTPTTISAPAGFARRVSFDNYAPAPTPTAGPTGPPGPTVPTTPTTRPSGEPRAGILKAKTKARTTAAGVARDAPSGSYKDTQEEATDNDTAAAGTTASPLSSSPTATHNALFNNYTLQSSNTSPANTRKKSYSQLSDTELLALDNQFNFKPVDIQKSYGFPAGTRLSYNAVSDSDKNPIINSKKDNHFKNLSPNAILKEYPTKPIITKNSICVNFKHSNLSNNDINNKFYLILLSKKSASLTSLNYYMNNISNKGDSIIICCSLSTSILGNDKSQQLDDFIQNFTQTILNYLLSNKFPINITFEFFKSYSYFDEVLNLYQPNLIIVGTNNNNTKSTSITTTERKLISLVYVGNDQFNQFNQSNNTRHDPQVNFKLPFKQKSSNTLPNINISKSPSNSISSDVDDDGDSEEYDETDDDIDEDDNNIHSTRLSKQKTNDTIVSSLFDNLNDRPALGPESPSTSNDQILQSRRKSMLDMLGSDFDSCAISDDLSESNAINLLSPPMKHRSRSSNNGSFNSLDNEFKDRQQLFEKYNRRLSQVNVDPKSNPKSTTTNSSVSETTKKSGFFKKLFGKS